VHSGNCSWQTGKIGEEIALLRFLSLFCFIQINFFQEREV